MHVLDCLEAGIATGRETGCRLYASRAREMVAQAAMGEARAGVPMRAASLIFEDPGIATP